MGLDFFIQRHRTEEEYKSDAWEDVVYGRNCYHIREIVLNNISTYNKETQEGDLTIGTLNKLLYILSQELKEYNFSNYESLIYEHSADKLFSFISQLAETIREDLIARDYDDIHYKYKLVDSY